ncbi:hypothetical protein SGRIM128S_08123 [Streptomyces griseomycini]
MAVRATLGTSTIAYPIPATATMLPKKAMHNPETSFQDGIERRQSSLSWRG